MKRLKLLWAVACAFVLAIGACFVAACGDTAKGVKLVESSETLVVIEATETGGSLYDAMTKLKAEEKITFEGSEGQFGYFLSSVNGTEQAVDYSSYWAVYTSLGDYDEVSYSNAEYGTYTYREKSYASASFGVSGLPMVEGNTYLLVYVTL